MNQPTIEPETSTIRRNQAIAKFVDYHANYYVRQFNRLDESTKLIVSFNKAACLLGPIWWGARHLWLYFWIFLFLEGIAYVQIFRGFFAQLGSDEFARSARLLEMAQIRQNEADNAFASGADNANTLLESALALESAGRKALHHAEQIAAQAPLLTTLGILMILAVKLIQGFTANKLLKIRFQRWRADQTMSSGVNSVQAAATGGFFLTVVLTCGYRFSAMQVPSWLTAVPVDKNWRRNAESMIDDAVQWLTETFSVFFGGVTLAIRYLLDFLETVIIGTPWIIVISVILLIAAKAAGIRVAIYTAVALAYLAIFGFWEKSMLTVALLGSACLICIVVGIPLGVLCQRKTRIRKLVWPILDLMQTMPSFVYLIPVIAFFGIGKPPGIIATIIFGMPPVVRLTVLGLQGVPEHIREAATAFGASDFIFYCALTYRWQNHPSWLASIKPF